jgi:DNA primase
MLAREVGVELPEIAASRRAKSAERAPSARIALPRQRAPAQAYYEKPCSRADPRALAYVQRSPRPQRRDRHAFLAPRLRAAEPGQAMTDALMAKADRLRRLCCRRVGLLGAKRREQQRRATTKLRGRVVFPIAIPGEYVAGFGARRADWLITDEADKGPKYLNSPESPIYDKSRIFYGPRAGKDDIRKGRSRPCSSRATST